MTIKYDFAGWVTKNDIRCSDGVVIKHDAFRDNDGQKVPLVWNHDYNSPDNVLGHVLLQNHDKGVYGYGFFNDTPSGQNANKLVKNGDISSMSIGARKLKRNGSNIIHGSIYEVSLVLAGANPGATIETVLTHSDDGNEEGYIFPKTLIHAADDIIREKDDEELDNLTHAQGQTIEDVMNTMTDIQQEAVYALLGLVAEAKSNKKDDDTMKQNIFDKNNGYDNTLQHSANDLLKAAISAGAPSLKKALVESDDVLQHGINSIEMLFPEVGQSTNGNTPIIYKDPNTAYKTILNSVHKSPFSRVRTTWADLTEEEARAKGYIKGNMKKEQFFSLIKRKTEPTTVYKKQKLDRDDIIDIEDFSVVSFINQEMRMMLEEEIARALLVGDGRDAASEDKIDEERIRPIISDNDFFTIKKAFAAIDKFEESVLTAMTEYRGSGSPVMYVDPAIITAAKLLKGTDGRYLTGSIPSNTELATRWGLGGIVETSFMVGKGAIIVNLRDYTLGASKGGQISTFDDFDIDFNQHKYLIETRLSGSLTVAKSAIHLAQGTAGTGADDETAGLTYGQRQADKA